MIYVSSILLSKDHILHPTVYTKAPEPSKREKIITGIVLALFTFFSFGVVLYLYYQQAKEKIRNLNTPVDILTPIHDNRPILSSVRKTNNQLTQAYKDSGVYLNYKGDNSPFSHLLLSIKDIAKGFLTLPHSPLQESLFSPNNRLELQTDETNAYLGLQWIGHASFLMQYRLGDYAITLLTDPNYSNQIPLIPGISAYERMTPPGLSLEETPTPYGIFITHNHADHCDSKSLEFFKDKQPVIYSPQGTGTRLKKDGFTNAQDFSWWDSEKVSFSETCCMQFTCVPAHHSSTTSATTSQKELWNGWVLQFPCDNQSTTFFTVYVMGDTACHQNVSISGYNPQHKAFDQQIFNEIKQQFPVIDLLLVPIDPISGEEETHMNQLQAIDLIKTTLQPVNFIPMHYGTWPFNEHGHDMLAPLNQFEAKIKNSPTEKQMIKMQVGATQIFNLGETLYPQL